MSAEKKIRKAVEALKKNHYMVTAAMINDEEVVKYLRDFTYTDDEDVRVDQIENAADAIRVLKAIYDLNWLRGSSVVYKLPSDYIYDEAVQRYIHHKDGMPEPFQAHIPSGMRSMKHDYPELVGTLDKAYDIRDVGDKMSVEKFLRKVMDELGTKQLWVSVHPKYDGASISATFQSETSNYGKSPDVYKPIKATSRGDFDNNLGVDMTNVVKAYPPFPIPTVFHPFNFPEQIGVQYEALVTEEGRERLSQLTGVTYKTRRAASAAAVKRMVSGNLSDDELREYTKCLSLIPIGVSENAVGDNDWQKVMSEIIDSAVYGFDMSKPFNRGIDISAPIEGILDTFQHIVQEAIELRPTLDYSIDGLVISVVKEAHRTKLGRANNKNRWQIAYKFDALVQRTHVKGILTTQGKQGYMGHNILFDEVEFNGVTYDKAPVNNITRFNNLDLRIGDEVLVSYNADVMGYIYKDETCKPNMEGAKIKLPTKCINCDEPLTVIKDKLLCENPDCPGHGAGRILEAARIFSMDYFGEETAADLVEAGITTTLQFITMTKDDLEKALKGKNLDKAWEEFQKKVKAPVDYSKVIDLLRIPALRTKTAEKIIKHLGVNQFMDLWMEAVEKGEIRYLASRIASAPGIKNNAKPFAEALVLAYPEFVKLKEVLNVVDESAVTYDKTVLISGFRTDPEFFEICKRLNYKVTDSGKYDILVVTPDRMNGTKATAARKSGKPIFTLSGFIETYKNFTP